MDLLNSECSDIDLDLDLDFAEEIARQMQDCEASVLVCIPQMVDTMKKVAEMCPSIRRMVVLGSSEGFVAIADMFKDSGDLFNDNIQVIQSINLQKIRMYLIVFFKNRLMLKKTHSFCPIQGKW